MHPISQKQSKLTVKMQDNKFKKHNDTQKYIVMQNTNHCNFQ